MPDRIIFLGMLEDLAKEGRIRVSIIQYKLYRPWLESSELVQRMKAKDCVNGHLVSYYELIDRSKITEIISYLRSMRGRYFTTDEIQSVALQLRLPI